jgi:hypothetical protein
VQQVEVEMVGSKSCQASLGSGGVLAAVFGH